MPESFFHLSDLYDLYLTFIRIKPFQVMNMLLAVLEKRAGFKLIQKDVFLNIAGGLKVNDPAIDLAVISAILSSSLDISIEQGVCMCGEVGLSGEIRPVSGVP